MGLEINLLSIIPLINRKINIFPSEASIKYFVTQTIASYLILTSIIINLNSLEFIPQNYRLFIITLINSGFLIKIGAAPFHFWFPEIIEGLNWPINLIILTWQKIAPIILLINNLQLDLFIILVIIYSIFIGGIQGLNQIRLRKILTFSSINHIAWIIARILYSNSNWLVYFITYSVISINLVILIWKFNIFFLKQLLNSINQNKQFKLFFSLNFLSLGGLPPFLGFLPKWMTVNLLIFNNLLVLATILIVITLITLFFYIRIFNNFIMIYSLENIINLPYLNSYILIFNLIALSRLILRNFIIYL